MPAVVIPIEVESPLPLPLPSPGESLSAMERSVPAYRQKVSGGIGGVARAAHRVDGYRDGWQACIAYLKSRDVR
jgi:hypothetical protein